MGRLAFIAIISVLLTTGAGVRGQTSKLRTLTGSLMYITLDGVEQYLIRDSSGMLVRLGSDYMPPETDSRGTQILPGAIVQLDCLFNATTGTCTPDASSSIVVLTTSAVMAPAPGSTTTQKLLVMILDYPSCNVRATVNEATVRGLYLGPNQDGNGGIAQKYSQCSYGKFKLDPKAFRALVVPLTCSAPLISGCDWFAMSVTANTAAQKLLGTTAFSSFTHFTYVVPPGAGSSCTWAGLALLPGSQTWLQTSSGGLYRWSTVMQEGIHNYGLWHSWQNGVEYDDYSTAMGRGDACPNAAEISRMGWATPAVGGDQLSSNVLQPGSARAFVLPATYLTGNNSYIRVQPDWLPNYNDFNTGKNLYIAVRVAKNGDAALGSSYAGKVNIHEVRSVMDNGYPSSYINGDRRITFVGAVSSMSSLTLSAYKLVVYGGSWTNGDYMRVYVCRYNNAASECPAIQNLDSRSSSSPPPSPSPPPPSRSPPPPPPTKADSAIELAAANASIWGTTNIGAGKPFSDTQAKWIWYHAGAQSGSSAAMAATFTATFSATSQTTRALLHIMVDDTAEVFLNRILLGSFNGGWGAGQYTNRPINLTLATGTNTLSIRVRNTDGPAGLLASVTSVDGRTVLTRTSSAWTYTLDAQNAPGSFELAAAAESSNWGSANIGPGKPFTDTQAKWIWYHAGGQSGSSTALAATFSTTVVATADQGTPARLHIIADDTADVYLNGALVGSVTWGWGSGQYTNRPLSLTLAKGTNTLSIRVRNTGGPAGVLASLTSADGATVLARTSSAWTYTTDALGALGALELAAATAAPVWGTDNIGAGKPFTDTQAKWIWYHTGATSSSSTATRATFTTTVVSAAQGTQALLHIIVDDTADVFLNGALVRSVTWGWRSGEYVNRPLSLTLDRGTNTLSIRARNTRGAAGLLASLTSADGRTVLTRTNSSWTYTTDAMGAPGAVELAAANASIWGTTNIGAGKLFSDTQAKWIWYHAGGQSSSSQETAATFSTTVVATADQGTQALLHIMVDDAAEVLLNGVSIGSVTYGWEQGQYSDRPLSLTLAKGTNTLSIRALNIDGPAGLLASLTSADGRTVLARTSSAWTYTTDAQGAQNAVEQAAAAESSNWGSANIGQGKPFTDTQAMWIWYHASSQSGSSMDTAVTFWTTVVATADQGTPALLHIIVDDLADVYLNGASVGSTLQWGWAPGQYNNRPVKLTLAKGTNTLSIRVRNTGGPAGVLASLTSADGATVLARTSSAWTYTTDAKNAPGAIELAAADASVWGTTNIGAGKLFSDTQAKWIWYHAGAQLGSSSETAVTFSTTLVTYSDQGTPAQLHIIVDDSADVYINGVLRGSVTWGWGSGQYTNRPLSLTLPRGTSTLSVRVNNNAGGPAGLLASLVSADGGNVLARTSSAWTYTTDAQRAPSAVELAAADKSVWGTENIGSGKPFSDMQAKWIWADGAGQTGSSTFKAATFATTIMGYSDQGTPALLHIMVDDTAEVFLNGVSLGSFKWGWATGQYTNRPLKLTLARGTNTLSIRVQDTGGNVGLLASLTSADGRTVLARTSSAWTVTAEEAK